MFCLNGISNDYYYNQSYDETVGTKDHFTLYERAFLRAVGARIEMLRHRRGLGLEDVAAYTVHSAEWLSGLEAGTQEPRLDDLFQIAKALGTNPGSLVSVEVKL